MLWNILSSFLYCLYFVHHAGVEKEETDKGHHKKPPASAATGPTIKSLEPSEFTIIISKIYFKIKPIVLEFAMIYYSAK